MKTLRLGHRVRLGVTHWLRPNEEGTVIEYNPRAPSATWLVLFENAFQGGGIDGDKLWLHDNDMEPAALGKESAPS